MKNSIKRILGFSMATVLACTGFSTVALADVATSTAPAPASVSGASVHNIRVHGVGEIEVKPDIANIRVSVTTKGSDPAVAQAENTKLLQNL